MIESVSIKDIYLPMDEAIDYVTKWRGNGGKLYLRVIVQLTSQPPDENGDSRYYPYQESIEQPRKLMLAWLKHWKDFSDRKEASGSAPVKLRISVHSWIDYKGAIKISLFIGG